MNKKYYELTCDFLKSIENRTLDLNIQKFYHPDVVQVEYPNALTKVVTKRQIKMIEEGIASGRRVLEKESYELIKYYEIDDIVIIEVIWKGILAVPIGSLKIGDEMKAYFAQIYEFKDDRIYRQRNYDCFEPFTQK